MNMTQAILERMQEVELEITPEFQKPEEPEGQLSYTVVDELLQAMGWINEGSKSVLSDHPKKTVSMTRWHYPDMPGTYIAALRNLFAGKPGPNVYEMHSWRADWGVQKIAPHLKDVEDTAKFLTASYGLATLGAMGVEDKPGRKMAELDQEMEAIGWKVVASSGTGVLVYERSGVKETIEVTPDKDDNIVSAEVILVRGTSAIAPPSVEAIVARAKAIESWAS
jgi:hypothetical protein